jgi:hypothetical protein
VIDPGAPGADGGSSVPPGTDGGDPQFPGGPSPDAPPDTPPDAPNTCADNSHCPESASQCSDSVCVACTVDEHCRDGGRCTASKTCVECLTGADCKDATRPFCTTANACVECQSHTDCKGAEQPLCAEGACVACEDGGGSAACAEKTGNTLPICLSGGGCAQCGESTDCKAEGAPICIQNKCEPCTKDSECKERDGDKPGICLYPRAGRCAKDEETIYVQGATPCAANAGQGTSAMPFCQPQRALTAVSNTRRIIRVRGPEPLLEMDIQASGSQITIIGQEGATITSPAEIGVQVRSGNVHIRGLRVLGNQSGIIVSGGATVQLNRVVVELNREGGLQIANGATYDVTNSVFAKNGLGSVGAARYGGVFLGTPGSGRTGQFRANTVVDNMDAGVVCDSASQSLVGVLLFNNFGANWFNCRDAPSGRDGVDPRFSASRAYHLTDGSPCKDAMMSADMPLDDFDGEPRPYPPGSTRSDCGADEYHPAP